MVKEVKMVKGAKGLIIRKSLFVIRISSFVHSFQKIPLPTTAPALRQGLCQ